MGAFHAYDIRGRWGVDFDRDTVYKVGFFLPELLGCREVAVGRDMRLSSPVIHEALLRGLTDAGADVFDLGLATTPYVYYATAAKGFKASVQITASMPLRPRGSRLRYRLRPRTIPRTTTV